ncbi:hypothetical protein CEXT_586481 [Caerostris extrusa]|uniref:Uncharacterized protein n=1 Tax=Caerostris extrusa TaxID=172846 RepID=A0AAV4RFQ2_CAEEX|nr:hypothetical protein CEXT_586481 [Caerostris extrusa]
MGAFNDLGPNLPQWYNNAPGLLNEEENPKRMEKLLIEHNQTIFRGSERRAFKRGALPFKMGRIFAEIVSGREKPYIKSISLPLSIRKESDVVSLSSRAITHLRQSTAN